MPIPITAQSHPPPPCSPPPAPGSRLLNSRLPTPGYCLPAPDYRLNKNPSNLTVFPHISYGPFDPGIAAGIILKDIMYGNCGAGTQPNCWDSWNGPGFKMMLRAIFWSGKSEPFFPALTLSRCLLMSEYRHAMLGKTGLG